MTHAPDAFDMEAAEEDADDGGITCMHCGAEGLYWQDTWDGSGNRRPRLYEDGKPHVCRPSPDDFEVLE